MRAALDQAVQAREEGNDPVGSVIVSGGEIVARGRNRIHTMNDPTAHAETVAIRSAGAARRVPHLHGCALYTTFEPCPMCCGAILNAGIATLILGGRPAPGEGRFGPYSVEWFLEQTGWAGRLELVTGVLADEGYAISKSVSS